MAKQWEPYKEEILRLFMIEDLTLDQVMNHMSTSRGFHRKKYQYEYRLKKWCARKNMKKEEWEYISHQYQKRGRTQNNPGVYVNCIILSRSRVDRALQRYHTDITLAHKFGKASSPQLAHGHLVRLASLQNNEFPIDLPESLPWLQFEQRFTITLPKSTRLLHLLVRAAQNLGLMPDAANKNSFDFARAINIASRETSSSAFDPACVLQDSWDSAMSFISSNNGGIAAQLLKTILFEVSNGSRKALVTHSVNFSKTDRGDNLIVLFRELYATNPTVLDQLTIGDDPTSEAIFQSLYEDAVRYSQIPLISTLLDAGKDVHALLNFRIQLERRTCRDRLQLYLFQFVYPITPLQWAASVCDVKLATFLIGAGAKADIGYPTPLAIACSTTKANDADVLEFARLLIHHGVRVNVSADSSVSNLARAVTSGNKSLVQLLLQHGSMDFVRPRTTKSSPRITLKHEFSLNERYGMRFPTETTETEITDDPLSALQLSIVVGNRSITDMLIQSVAHQDNRNEIFQWALITACTAGEADLVHRLLAHLEAHSQDRINLVNEIILATAWDTECRIARLLIDQRVVQRELRNSAFSFFQAAALHGNVPLIKLLKSRDFDINSGSKLQFRFFGSQSYRPRQPPPLASTPMGCAVWMSHKDAIETLLTFGANLAGLRLVHAIQSGSDDLLFQVMDRCDDLDKLRVGPRALRVAILHRRGITLIRKLIEAGAVPDGHDLINAVRSDDQEVVHFLLPSCDVLATTEYGWSVLEAASCTGNLDIAKLYFDRGGLFSSRAILLAASRATKTHDYRMVRYLVTTRRSGPTDAYEATALALSIYMEDLVCSALSIYCPCEKRGASSPKDKEIQDCVYPIAYINEHMDIKDLFEGGCYRGSKCHKRLSPMSVAALLGQEALWRMMLNRGYLPDAFLVNMCYQSSNIREKIRDAIKVAYTSQISLVADCDWHERLLMAVLKHTTDIKIFQDHLGILKSLDFWRAVYGDSKYGGVEHTPLGWAARSGRHELVELFLKAGANPNAHHASNHNHAFVCAIESGHLDIASLLLDYGSDINAHRSAAFRYALLQGNFRAMTFLLKKGANINIPFYVEGTPLEIAADHGMIDAIALIFTGNVDIHGRMRIHFVRAVANAIRRCFPGTAKILKQRGGWSEQDQEISQTPRGTSAHCCPRFSYDDSSLEACQNCQRREAHSSSQIVSEDYKDTTFVPADVVVVAEEVDCHEASLLAGSLSIFDLESESAQVTETTTCPLLPYGLQDRELDNIVRELLLEDGMIVDAE